MKISIKKTEQTEQTAVVFLSKEQNLPDSLKAGWLYAPRRISKEQNLPDSLKAYNNMIDSLFKEGIFKGDKKNSFFIPLNSKESSYNYLLLVGMGDKKSLDYETVRQISAKAYKELKTHGQSTADILAESLITKNTSDWERLCQALSEGLILSSYKCDDLKKAGKQKKEVTELFLCVPPDKQAVSQKALKTGQILGEAANFVKKLANYPGNLMTPSILANEVEKQTQNTKISTTIWDKKRIKKERMGGLLGVSLGSSEEPRFIIMEYKGAEASKKPVILVGKGLTFDSGGISLKSANAMDEMKFDMCGATAVIGAMLAIEKLDLKVNVTGLVPSSENMPGQSANKPGDILTARNGKTMEVLNTDAEGRLILADALSYASEQKPQVIFDAATLTGAIIACLGNIFTGFFTKDESLVTKIKQASKQTGERVWQMPLTKEHTEDIKSVFADVANISSTKGAGSSTAAAFLEHFVDKEIPWAHFDIAGTAWNVSNRLEYCSKKMASGVMVRTFVELARSYQ